MTALGDRIAFCDPAGGKAVLRRTQARSAIVVVAQDALARIFVLHTWADRVPTDRLYQTIFEVNRQFRPRQFGIEANGLQSLFGDGVRREARLDGMVLPLVPVMQPQRLDKTFRNRTALQPVIGAGRLFLQPHQHELRAELATHPMAPTCDLVDALASAIGMLPAKVYEDAEHDEVSALAQYLRRSRVPDWVIEQRVTEMRRRQAAARARHAAAERGAGG